MQPLKKKDLNLVNKNRNRKNLQLEPHDQSSKDNGRGYHSKVEPSQFLQSPNLRYEVISANTQEHACYPGEDTMRPDISATTKVGTKNHEQL